MPNLTRRAGALGLLTMLLAAACGSSVPDADPARTAAALEGQFSTLDGASIDLAELRGQDVVLWFWAPW